MRGFSVKMYTQQGNWDFVGNNIPVSKTPGGGGSEVYVDCSLKRCGAQPCGIMKQGL